MNTYLQEEDLKERFLQSFPDAFYLEKENIEQVEHYLKTRGWLRSDDKLLSLEKPGEGNMNYVLRALFVNSKSIILKQARPWVEKFPTINAPVLRTEVEDRFFELTSEYRFLASHTPSVIGLDRESHILALEDLGEASDCTYVYQKNESFSEGEVQKVVSFINELNQIEGARLFYTNLEMRKLNHQHIFHLPFLSDNGFALDDIQPGLQDISDLCKLDTEVVSKASELGSMYLNEGTRLQHGDLYPGSILSTSSSFYVIDPEFSFIAPMEWDISIFIAHLFLAEASETLIQTAIKAFEKSSNFNEASFSGFVGIEIIRRIIGLAQLPLELSLLEKEQLLRKAIGFIKSESLD